MIVVTRLLPSAPEALARLTDPGPLARLPDPGALARLADPVTLLRRAAPGAIDHYLGRLRRRIEEALIDEVGGGVGRVIAGVPDHHLETLVRSPARRPVLDSLFWGFPTVLDRTSASVLASCLRVHITSTGWGSYDVYWLQFINGRWRSGRGEPPVDPHLTIVIDAAELLRMGVGRRTPVQALLSGKLRARGNPVLAARLLSLARAVLGARPPAA